MDVEKLIERLKLDAADWAGDRYIKQDLFDSAEALTALQAENERLKSENIMHKSAADDYYNTSEEYRRERNDLLEELEKVKAERDAKIEETERMKAIMRNNGIMAIPPKHYIGRLEWNVPKPRGPQKEE